MVRASLGLACAAPLAPLLIWQGRRVRRIVPRLPEAEGAREGRVDAGRGGPALRLLLVGDSSAAGVGVDTQDDALAGRLLARLAPEAPGPLEWRLVARSGIATREALAMLEAEPAAPFDVAIVALGVNDVTAMKPASRFVADAARLVQALHARHRVRALLWSGLPPMHRFPALPQPLRAVIGLHAIGLDASLARWCAARPGGAPSIVHVPMPDMVGPTLAASDGFHPAAGAYALWADALAPRVLRAWSGEARPTAAGARDADPHRDAGRAVG